METTAIMSQYSACSYTIAASVFLVCTIGWVNPHVALSEPLPVKKRLATQSIYLLSVSSNKYPSLNPVDCAPTNFSCMQQGRSGPVPDELKASYANELRTQGLTVVMEKPSQGSFYEVSVSMSIKELPSSEPIIPVRFVCDINGRIAQHDAEGERNQSNDFTVPNKEIVSGNQSTYHLVSACLKPAAAVVEGKLRSMSRSKTKKY